MANVNLVTGEVKRDTSGFLYAGNLVIFIILVLVIAAYVGLIVGKNILDKNIQSAQATYSTDTAKFSQDSAKTVVDVQNRLSASQNLVNKGKDSADLFSLLEKDIVPGAYINEYKFDDATNTITLSGTADNYNTVAKQVLSFKSDSAFASVFGGQSTLDQTNNVINFTVILKLK